jgi:transposase
MRAAMNAILHPLRTGCPWRYLPRNGFPHRSTVYNISRKFRREETWEAIWDELHMALRERMGCEASPSAAVLESQIIPKGIASLGATKLRKGETSIETLGVRRSGPKLSQPKAEIGGPVCRRHSE